MENWRNSSTLSDRETGACRFKAGSSKNYNWRVSSEIDEQRNLDRSTLFHSSNYLIEMSNQNSYMVTLKIIEKLNDFAKFLKSKLETDWIVVTIAILSKVCSSCFRSNKLAILKTVVETSFLKQLENYVRNVKYEERAKPEKNKQLWKDPKEFFDNLLFVCDFFSEINSNTACKTMPKLLGAIDQTMTYLEKRQNLEVNEKKKLKIKTMIKKLNFSGQERVVNFRTSNVYPTSEEILTPNCSTPKNYFVEGKYDNVEHYLEVQFSKTKETFIKHLREDVAECIKFSTIRIYSNVVLQSIYSTSFEVGLKVKFSNQEAIEEIFAPWSKCFRLTQLVLFTKDNFSSVFLGHVIQRRSEEQCIIIGIEPEYNDFDLNASYTIIVLNKFWRSYYYSLKTLQCMSEVDFPMKKYLVDVDLSVELPGYLDASSSIYTIQGQEVDLFGNNWPSAEQLQLDSFQYSAFKAALTQKFNVIQGFPGTGKTYLGLQIVKTLLHEDNKKIWYNGTPILVLCLSNQALDSFLEGLISTTSKIIRIGDNVKNRKLEKFCLTNVRPKNYDYYKMVTATWRNKIIKLSKEIEEWILHLIRIKNSNVIINFTHFEIIDENFEKSWFSRVSSANLRSWLFDEVEIQNMNLQSIEISDVINEINNEETNFDCSDDKIASGEELAISDESEQTVLMSQSWIWNQLLRITKELQNIKSLNKLTDEVKKLETRLINLWKTYQYFKMKMSDGALSQPPSKPITVDYSSPCSMDPKDRWNLYFYWLNLYIRFVEKRLAELQYKHREFCNNLYEVGNMLNLEIINHTLVLGITVQAATLWHTTLQALGCRIIVVEEDSDILESELVVSLSKHCEHLILLGDHKKLRPMIVDDNINNRTNFSNSLMERMVINKMQYHVLSVQYRMSFQISQLLVPHIYSKFDDYPSVTSSPLSLGIPSNIFFVHHEPRDIDEHSTREYYLYEAKFLINLAGYLRKFGCGPEDITILVSCNKQLQVLCNESKKYKDLLKGVRICTLGEFQGQQSRVILLSLVKENHGKKIGYLKKEPRVIFALSRAKEYVYMMGNIDSMCQDNEPWSKIKQVLQEQNYLGNYFPLCCQNNPDHIIQINEPEDFHKIPKGVCSEICGSALNCGHRCLKSCHIFDCDRNRPTGIDPKINDNSTIRILDCGHEHVLRSYVGTKDFKCPTRVHVTLPCGHKTTQKPCHIDVNEWKCDIPCDARIEPCGHSCIRTCHADYDPEHIEYKCYKTCDRILKGCSTKTHKCQKYCSQECSSCKVIVIKELPDCKHLQAVECSESAYNILCTESCKKKIAKCGHDCKLKCYEPCGGCEEMVLKTLPSCGHQVWTKCKEPADVQNCHGSCPKLLPCGHPCVKKCNEICTERCRELVNHPKPTFCGHKFKTECYLQTKQLPNHTNSLPHFCEEPCAAVLDCSHKCSGTCEECFQGRIHATCMEKYVITLICGHQCKVRCGEVCQPCPLKCGMKCSHNKCTKTCGEVCTKCQESCTRRCIHAECTAKCGDICTVLPCPEPCEKKLPCSHSCVGYCGDPCPPLCRTCNADREVFLGYEDKHDARFVLLDECKHVIESSLMERLCKEAPPDEIHYIKCPKCGTQLTSTQRYSDYIKRTINDIVDIKRKSCGSFEEIEEKRKELQEQLVQLKVLQQLGELQSFDKFITDCYSLLEPIKNSKRQRFNLSIGKTLQAKLTIVQNIGNILQTQTKNDSRSITPNSSLTHKAVNLESSIYVEYLFTRLTQQLERITNQEIQDFEKELIRLQRITQFANLGVSSSSKEYKKLKELIYKPVIYTEDYDKIVTARLEKFLKKVSWDGKLAEP